ncbi:Tyrosine-protein phosphatase non-receptor type 9 [Cichlidogyrus casuarinus]|uniref:Tyrosine-protein phosphatase non-receptor type 9 n=1 Tax=Cichlidogyrus casuarinus TaxID=1844966 RepID=A0ABD2QF85_9PLAT
MRSSWKLDEFNPLDNDIRKELLSEKFTVICTNSCTIALFNAKRHWPPISSNVNLLKGLLYQLDCAMSNDVAQKNGITLIYNMNDSKYDNFDYPLSQKLLDIFTGCYPARLVKVLIVGPPFWFRFNLWCLRILLREKMRDRLFTVEQNELKNYLPIEHIPLCLGGSLQHNHLDWIRTCLSRSDHLSLLPEDYFDSNPSSSKRSQFQFPVRIHFKISINCANFVYR